MPATLALDKHSSEVVTEGVRITVRPAFLPEHSCAPEKRFLFNYSVTIRNEGTMSIRLASRHWRIVDGDGDERLIDGAGVVGEHPELNPGDSFEYSSYCPMHTAWGTMEGHYSFERDGVRFDAKVGRFFLVS